MRNEETDLAAIYDMWVAARDLQDFIDGVSLTKFSKDKMMRLAVERAIEIIAEASKRLREEFRITHSEIPWQKIISQRNIIAHEYDKIQIEKIWIVSTELIPVLLRQIEPLIPEEFRISSDS